MVCENGSHLVQTIPNPNHPAFEMSPCSFIFLFKLFDTEHATEFEWLKCLLTLNGLVFEWFVQDGCHFQTPSQYQTIFCLDFEWLGLGMVLHIAMSLAMTDHSKTELF